MILIIAKHFSYAGKEEFNFAMAEHEYNRFARTELAASGRTKWSGTTMQAVSKIAPLILPIARANFAAAGMGTPPRHRAHLPGDSVQA